jgi:hypothetical protein
MVGCVDGVGKGAGGVVAAVADEGASTLASVTLASFEHERAMTSVTIRMPRDEQSGDGLQSELQIEHRFAMTDSP